MVPALGLWLGAFGATPAPAGVTAAPMGAAAAHTVPADPSADLLPGAELTPADLRQRRALAAEAGPGPAGVAVPTPAAASAGPVCSGTGTDGPRVQAVYAHRGPEPSPSVLSTIAAAAADVDTTFADSAAKTGGQRRVRWVTTSGPGCALVVATVRISDEAAASALAPGGLFDELVTKGLADPTRRYLVWTEGDITAPRGPTCGVGEYFSDDRPGPGNLNANPGGSYGPTFAAVDDRCWGVNAGHSVPAHELMHMLGAVQDSAPHADGTGHCTDDFDAMCYGPLTAPVPGCLSPAQERLFDCNDDDYFHTDPLAGTYLCRRWNTARNPYLHGSGDLAPPRAPAAVSASGASGRVTVLWAASPSCEPPDAYRVSLDGGPAVTVAASADRATLAAAPGRYTARVTSLRGGVAGGSRTTVVTVPAPPNRAPVGSIVLWGTDRRNLALFGYALDPDTDAPIRVIVAIEGVGFVPVVANVAWDEIPRRHPGYSRNHAFLVGRQLPPGSRSICVVAEDATGGPSTNLGCVRVTVK